MANSVKLFLSRLFTITGWAMTQIEGHIRTFLLLPPKTFDLGITFMYNVNVLTLIYAVSKMSIFPQGEGGKSCPP